MSSTKTKPKLNTIIASLRRRVAQGDVSAMSDLGMWLQEGFQDKKGRAVIRRDPAYAFRLFKRAAATGYAQAFASLGYAYDVGLGTRRNKSRAMYWYIRAYRNGQSIGAANLATIHRDRGELSSMLHWWMRAAALGDGDALGDAGYCYQYGIGVRKSIASARRLYRRAIASRDVSMWGREEALYQLAISYLDAGEPKLALPLLKRAAKDGDYPEAAALISQLAAKDVVQPCRCRRFINRDLKGHAACPIHAREGKQRK
jgi:TPR repeat protein